jgi:2-keto-4-pentenoate hydratase
LLDTMHVANGETVATSRMLRPRIEAEIVVIHPTDLDGDDRR